MMVQILAIAIIAYAYAGDSPPAQENAPKPDTIKGAWVVASVDTGLPLSLLENAAKDGKVQITDAEVIFRGQRDAFRLRYKITPGKKTKWIDFTEEKGKPVPAIYTLDGDLLKICIAGRAGQKRPTEFRGKPEPDGQVLFVLRRKR